LPECCIFIAVLGDTHIKAILGHMSIWPKYGYMASDVDNIGVFEKAIQMQLRTKELS
jgi:hypothetical protein